jgi:hypothetical protein
LLSRRSNYLVGLIALVALAANCAVLRAQDDGDARETSNTARSRNGPNVASKKSQRTATIHWQRVPLRDAIGRLQALFDDSVFVDRRIDPGMRITLDIEAASAEEVVAAIASGLDLGEARLGRLVYLGPNSAADQLRTISNARTQEVGRLPSDLRASLTRKEPTTWPRLGEPRRLITSIVEERGWRIANADAIPHDLWSAGELPALTLAEQLTVLLVGFDLTFELQSSERSIAVVPLKEIVKSPGASPAAKRTAAPPNTAPSKKDGKQVFTLRVQEQPVGAVLKELQRRLHWAVQIDEESIRAAGKSLDKRVSFSVENADQQHLLDALLQPAGLDYRLEGEQVRIVAGRYEK